MSTLITSQLSFFREADGGAARRHTSCRHLMPAGAALPAPSLLFPRTTSKRRMVQSS
jgi:hypothetical protein